MLRTASISRATRCLTTNHSTTRSMSTLFAQRVGRHAFDCGPHRTAPRIPRLQARSLFDKITAKSLDAHWAKMQAAESDTDGSAKDGKKRPSWWSHVKEILPYALISMGTCVAVHMLVEAANKASVNVEGPDGGIISHPVELVSENMVEAFLGLCARTGTTDLEGLAPVRRWDAGMAGAWVEGSSVKPRDTFMVDGHAWRQMGLVDDMDLRGSRLFQPREGLSMFSVVDGHSELQCTSSAVHHKLHSILAKELHKLQRDPDTKGAFASYLGPGTLSWVVDSGRSWTLDNIKKAIIIGYQATDQFVTALPLSSTAGFTKRSEEHQLQYLQVASNGASAMTAVVDSIEGRVHFATLGQCCAVAGYEKDGEWFCEVIRAGETGGELDKSHTDPKSTFGLGPYKWTPEQRSDIVSSQKTEGVFIPSTSPSFWAKTKVTPAVTHRPLKTDHHGDMKFVVLGTGGLWDRMTPEEAALLIAAYLREPYGTRIPHRPVSTRFKLQDHTLPELGLVESVIGAFDDQESGYWAFNRIVNASTLLIRNSIARGDEAGTRLALSLRGPLARMPPARPVVLRSTVGHSPILTSRRWVTNEPQSPPPRIELYRESEAFQIFCAKVWKEAEKDRKFRSRLSLFNLLAFYAVFISAQIWLPDMFKDYVQEVMEERGYLTVTTEGIESDGRREKHSFDALPKKLFEERLKSHQSAQVAGTSGDLAIRWEWNAIPAGEVAKDGGACYVDRVTTGDDTKSLGMFSIFGGHGKWEAAEFLRSHLHGLLRKSLGNTQDVPASGAWTPGSIAEAMKRGYESTDRALLDQPRALSKCNATEHDLTEAVRQANQVASAATALVDGENDMLYVASAGQCRAVAAWEKDGVWRCDILSQDHAYANKAEKER